MTSQWRHLSLGEVAPAQSLVMPTADTVVWNLSLEDIAGGTGRILLRQTCRVDELGSSKCVFDERYVLYSKLRPYLNKVALPASFGVGTSELIPLRPRDGLDREFLAFYLRSPEFLEFANANTRGANLPRISMAELWDHKVPVPPTLTEQRHIVARIKECMERVDEIEANATTVGRELDALFPALLNERFAAIRDANGARLLEDVADIRGGGSLPKGTAIDEGSSSVLLLKVGDMNADGNERTIETSREFLPMTDAGRAAIEAGAVIFPKRGGAIATNKKRLLGRPALLDPNLMAVVAKREILRPDYLYYWCLGLDLSKLANGGVIPQLNRKDLAPLELPLPDIAAQGRIVEELQLSEQYCSQLKIEFESVRGDRARLREAILRKAFAGEL